MGREGVERTVVVKLPVRGPGVDQRDAWAARVAVTDSGGGELRFEKTAGMSGKFAYVKLNDLIQLVKTFSEERSR